MRHCPRFATMASLRREMPMRQKFGSFAASAAGAACWLAWIMVVLAAGRIFGHTLFRAVLGARLLSERDGRGVLCRIPHHRRADSYRDRHRRHDGDRPRSAQNLVRFVVLRHAYRGDAVRRARSGAGLFVLRRRRAGINLFRRFDDHRLGMAFARCVSQRCAGRARFWLRFRLQLPDRDSGFRAGCKAVRGRK